MCFHMLLFQAVPDGEVNILKGCKKGKILSQMWLSSIKESDNRMYRKRRGRVEKERGTRETLIVTESC